MDCQRDRENWDHPKGVKKKTSEVSAHIVTQISILYPDVYNNAGEKVHQAHLKKHIYLLTQSVIDDIDRTDEIKKSEKYFISQLKPKEFMGDASVELKIERDFEKLCIILEKHSTREIKKLTVKEFYALLHYIKENKNT